MGMLRTFTAHQRSHPAPAARSRFASRPWTGAVPAPTGSGKPLPEGLRRKMERAFGQDFQDVRLHLGGEAAAAQAVAFARRSAIHLSASRFDPASQQGQRLLGHELAHVVQQRQRRVGAPSGGRSPIVEDSGLEAEAESAGARAAQGQRAPLEIRGRVPPALPAQPDLPAPVQREVVRINGGPNDGQFYDTQFPQHKFPTQEAAEENARRMRLAKLRVLGHGKGEEATEEDDTDIRSIQEAIETLKGERRQAKAEFSEALYTKRKEALKAGQFSFREIHKEVPEVEQVTHAKVQERLNDPRLTYEPPTDLHETHIKKDGRVIYKLFGGLSAFEKDSSDVPPLARQIWKKKGSDKQYVKDDRGVPTRRHAYAVKSANQIKRLKEEGELKGRFLASGEHKSILDLSDEEKILLQTEEGQVDENTALFLHQIYGSGERQRGVSATTTNKPLLSNVGAGFATQGEGKSVDPGARKLVLDLAKVPQGGLNLVNLYHQIPDAGGAIKAPRQFYSQGKRRGEPWLTSDYGQDQFNWSVRKNRELFIHTVTPELVAEDLDPAPEDKLILPELFFAKQKQASKRGRGGPKRGGRGSRGHRGKKDT